MRSRRGIGGLVIAAALLASVSGPAAAAPAPFDPAVFFNGRTQGAGKLKIILRRSVDVRVEGSGHVERDGTLVLAQVVHEGDKPARTRRWRIRETSPGHYAGTLSDAQGPVTGEVTANRLHLAFTSLDGYANEQWITFAADGRSAHNVLKVHKLGMTVAELDETIRKLD